MILLPLTVKKFKELKKKGKTTVMQVGIQYEICLKKSPLELKIAKLK